MKNPTVGMDKKALEVFPIRPMGIREANQKALASTKADLQPQLILRSTFGWNQVDN
jgi:hypothetical protein